MNSEPTAPKSKKSILSGITPSGTLMIGHYTGAIKNWIQLQDEYECNFMIADQHAITVRQVPAELRKRTLEVVAAYIACGIDPEKVTLFVQSHVPEHAQLAWVLNTFTGFGECSRMTQFKDKSATHADNVNVGLFTYPVLMAADILLYQADLVPVGEDQKQHLELTRNLAERFNHHYSPTFQVPEPFIPPVGARIMSLQEPMKKMSKSDANLGATLFLDDSDDDIRRKIKRAVTDSDSAIQYGEKERPGVSNLLTLFHIATSRSIQELESEFNGRGYAVFKEAVGEALVEFLSPIRNRFVELRENKDELKTILEKGANTAQHKARKTLSKVYKKIGFMER